MKKMLLVLSLSLICTAFPFQAKAEREKDALSNIANKAGQNVSIIQKRAIAACLSLGGQYNINTKKCYLEVKPDEVCTLLKGIWTGEKCKFLGQCVKVE